jgi:hypothetical protein
MDHPKKYLAFVLSEESRKSLFKRFPPSFTKFICHHVTIKFNGVSDKDFEDWKHVKSANIVGFTADEFLEALVVELDGGTHREDDNSTFHITHSLDPVHRKPVDSNKLIKQAGFIQIKPVYVSGTVQLEPK